MRIMKINLLNRCFFIMYIRNILSALQSRRDEMFIAAWTPSALSPVGTICFEVRQQYICRSYGTQER